MSMNCDNHNSKVINSDNKTQKSVFDRSSNFTNRNKSFWFSKQLAMSNERALICAGQNRFSFSFCLSYNCDFVVAEYNRTKYHKKCFLPCLILHGAAGRETDWRYRRCWVHIWKEETMPSNYMRTAAVIWRSWVWIPLGAGLFFFPSFPNFLINQAP